MPERMSESDRIRMLRALTISTNMLIRKDQLNKGKISRIQYKPSFNDLIQIQTVPPAAPDAPVVSGLPGNLCALLSCNNPLQACPGVSTYIITISNGTVITTSDTLIIRDLINGTPYTFTVVARNSVGDSPPSKITLTPIPVPDTPVISGSIGNSSVTLRWNIPSNNGSDITAYKITGKNGSITTDITTNLIITSITGLTNGSPYTFTLVAVNSIGNSLPTTITLTPATVPQSPTVLGIAGNGTAILSWGIPANGGSAVISYKVTSINGTIATTSTKETITGLTNGVLYTFTVIATNLIGDSEPARISLIRATAPASPVVSGGSEDSSVILSWAPPWNSGAAITGYKVTSIKGTILTKSTTVNITGLTNGTSYTFTVVAINAIGVSEPSSISLIPRTVPESPIVSGVIGDSSFTISWNIPSNGGSAILGYRVSGINDLITTTSLTRTGLTNGTPYTISVVATNAIGVSAMSYITLTPAIVPGTPTVTGVTGISFVTLSWNEPSNGGSAITAYKVTGNNQTAIIGSTTSRNITLNNLTNGIPYTFTVVSTNSIGDSLPYTITLMPGALPESPIVTGVVGDSSVTLSWDEPPNGGLEIISYTITGNNQSITTSSRTATIGSLTNGTPYTFTVLATNFLGSSPLYSITLTPVAVPTAPTVTGTITDSSVTLAWNEPSNGGSAITGYRVTGNNQTITTTSRNATIGSLINGTPYTFVVVAINAIGDSLPYNITITPATVPGSPTVTGLVGDSSVTLSWNLPSNGGSLITGYELTSINGTTITTSRTATIGSLINGTPYTFVVVATNSIGNSLPSSITLTPVTVPIAPTVAGTSGNTTASLSWNEPPNGGSAITGYSVTRTDGSTTTTITTELRTLSVTGLINGTDYTFTVFAINSRGSSIGATIILRPSFIVGEIWTQQNTLSSTWAEVICSSDGTKIIAHDRNWYGSFYRSTDSGITWTEIVVANLSSMFPEIRGIAASSDGTKIIVSGTSMMMSSGNVVISRDSGATWTQVLNTQNWAYASCSADFTKLAVATYGTVYISVDSGVTWTECFTDNNYIGGILITQDGSKIFCISGMSTVYINTSTNNGSTWTTNAIASPPMGIIPRFCASFNGTKLGVCNWNNGYIYTSTDSGVTWTQQTAAGQANWADIVSSADGNILIAAVSNPSGYIYRSLDGGVTWTQTPSGSYNWTSLAASYDCSKIVGVPFYEKIYTSP